MFMTRSIRQERKSNETQREKSEMFGVEIACPAKCYYSLFCVSKRAVYQENAGIKMTSFFNKQIIAQVTSGEKQREKRMTHFWDYNPNNVMGRRGWGRGGVGEPHLTLKGSETEILWEFRLADRMSHKFHIKELLPSQNNTQTHQWNLSLKKWTVLRGQQTSSYNWITLYMCQDIIIGPPSIILLVIVLGIKIDMSSSERGR